MPESIDRLSVRPWFVSVILALLPTCGRDDGRGVRDSDVAFRGVESPPSVRPTQSQAATPELVDLGRRTFVRHCAPCHGEDGGGEGAVAWLLYPRPRDLVAARYRLVSTWDRVPTDEDLFVTISRGMPGSAMPSWSHLPEETRWGLVHYVKSLAKRPWTIPPTVASPPGQQGEGILVVPPEPPMDEVARGRATEIFAKSCAPCHGSTGKGDGQQKQEDDKGFPTRPRDLTRGIFKGLPDAEAVYRRIVIGLPGSPMPTSSYLHGDDAWILTRWVLALTSEEQREKNEMRRFVVRVPLTEEAPSHPDDGRWREAPPVNLHLMPLWWRDDRPELLTVRALRDARQIAFLLQWSDETHDDTSMRPQDFRDACAIELSADPDPPFFGMGEELKLVNIWMWKSERQSDLDAPFRDLEAVYPNIGIDSYPNLTRAPYEQPLRHALTLESDREFVTAWAAGNIVADPTRKTPVENLVAQGQGTLRARPAADQTVEAVGVHTTGTYRVALRRSLRGSGNDAIDLKPRDTISVAFAVWNGAAGDRDGKKSVTIWQELRFED